MQLFQGQALLALFFLFVFTVSLPISSSIVLPQTIPVPFLVFSPFNFPQLPCTRFVPVASHRTVSMIQPILCTAAYQKSSTPRKAGLEEAKMLRLLTT